MNEDNKKYILKKLMRDALAEEERALLNDEQSVKHQMFGQWENAPDAARSDQTDGIRIWVHIQEKIKDNYSVRRVLFYKVYSAVASVLLLFAFWGMVYWSMGKGDQVPIFIVSSGIQNMQSVSLPDGTEVQLGPGSKLTYPSVFKGKKREIELDGQAFFDVAKDAFKPFVVHTSTMDVQALGTAFEVFNYEIENKSEAILLSGKVKINLNSSHSLEKSEFILHPDKMIVFDKQTDSAYVQVINADKYTSWRKQRILSFENEKLSMIIPRLEQWYGRQIMCQRDLADRYRFTFKIRDESLERILFMMGESSPLKYKKMGNDNYILSLK